MKQFSHIIFIAFFSFFISLAYAPKSQAAIPPKAKAFTEIVTYSTAGGALIGLASMVFNENPRTIAQGASLGLYAGIIFGSYVISSYRHSMSPKQFDPYDDAPPPGYYDDGAFGTRGYMAQNTLKSYDPSVELTRQEKEGRSNAFYMSVIQFDF